MHTVPTTAQRVRVLNMVWAAMIASVVIYWVLGGCVVKTISRAVPWPSSLLIMLLGVAATSLVGGIVWLSVAVAAIERRTVPMMLQQLTSTDKSILYVRLQFVFLISLALLEMPAILGLINRLADAAHPWMLHVLASSSLTAMGAVRARTFPVIVGLLNRLGDVELPAR